MIGAEHLAERAAATLSGGERRRVHLARTIALRPDILMLDEPFAGLDAEVRATLLEDALSAVRSCAKATLVVVHDRAEAWALADRLLVLIDGGSSPTDRPRTLLDRPPNSTVARFLGYDGSLRDGDETVMTRPSHVRLDPTARGRRGSPASSRRRTPPGSSSNWATAASTRAHRCRRRASVTAVRLRIEGGARFPGGPDGDPAPPPTPTLTPTSTPAAKR